MDGERFDAVLRRAVGDGSRRGILRIGVGALAASALGFAALSEHDDVIAKRKKKKKKKKPQQCTADRPITCGTGCCTSNFPTCCDDPIDTSGKVCAPSNSTCCPAAQGGGFCGQGFSCCPPISIFPVGYCCATGSQCCNPSSPNCPVGQLCNFGCCEVPAP